MRKWIDADALRDRLENLANEIADVADDMPAADVAPVRHGEWIKMSDSDGVYYCCSECGEELYRKWSFDREFDISPKKESIDKTNYCSACGADMRKVDGGDGDGE